MTTQFQIEYNELAGFNGDSSSVTVEEPRFSIDKLQPGRNYSIAIKAVSNGMESRATLYNLATSKTSHILLIIADMTEETNTIKTNKHKDSYFICFRTIRTYC